MEAIELVAAKRSTVGKKVAALRAAGSVPAVVYGRGVESESIEINAREMERVFAQAGGNKIVALKVGSGKPRNVLIHDVQTGGLRGELRHVDFYAVRMNEKLTAEVPLHFVGESSAVRQDDGVLVRQMEAVEVSCLPADLPEAIEVDITPLADFDQTITLGDLKLPKGVELAEDDLTQLVAKVEPPRSEAEMAELEESVEGELPEGVAEDQTAVKEENSGSADR
ncbi:MAG TPA: 50S ribosomal protein L25 [Candidatus Saccharimonadia bacterium]